MPNPMIRIHDIALNEVIDREMTADELKQHKTDQADCKAAETEAAAKAQAKADMLARLGITAEEAALLLA